MSKRRVTHERSEKKSETLEFRLGWSEKQAFKAACARDNTVVSARLRQLIQDHIAQSAEPFHPTHKRTLPMPRLFANRPRAFIAALVAVASTAVVTATAPSVASLDPRAAFERIDADSNGTLGLVEFTAYLERGGFFMTPDAPVDAPERLAEDAEITGAIRSEFARYDRDHDGAVSYGEFSGRYVWRMETSFNAIDRDRDGHIDTRELARVMGSIGLDAANLDRTRLNRAADAIAAIDTNNDGRLDFAEYSAVG